MKLIFLLLNNILILKLAKKKYELLFLADLADQADFIFKYIY